MLGPSLRDQRGAHEIREDPWAKGPPWLLSPGPTLCHLFTSFFIISLNFKNWQGLLFHRTLSLVYGSVTVIHMHLLVMTSQV